ncbi:uncharacterized protein N7511_010629 [Penicillium nucicola]|uniref:uncharacterized protein n=1 Tax=Penicillium nucicola TaxID=1850975 RepID=UPI002545226F|nr:uncharacterized protein N7511_010629 [Penicillium nucicola]KAJ5748933.1 hypothetical protein N7511_010629 [Penicillium nucicola]
MCDVPFFPIFPICFQCGTDQNPCHCKVVGPTLGSLLASFNILWLWFLQGWERVSCVLCSLNSWLIKTSMLGYPVKLNGQISNAIPF